MPSKALTLLAGAQPCQGWGRGFESPRPLQSKNLRLTSNLATNQRLTEPLTSGTAIRTKEHEPAFNGKKTRPNAELRAILSTNLTQPIRGMFPLIGRFMFSEGQ